MVSAPAQRILAGSSATLSATMLNQDGVLDTAATAVTVSVVRSDGTVVLAAGTATTLSVGVASVSLTAAQTAALDVLTATWSRAGTVVATTTVGVVGAFWATVQQIRESDPAIASNPTRYPTPMVVGCRNAAEVLFESALGRAFVPRFHRAVLNGTGTDRQLLPTWDLRRLRSVTIDGVAWSAPDLAAVPASTPGIAVRSDGGVWERGHQNVVAAWEHGADSPPDDLRNALLIWCRHRMNAASSAIPDRATSYVDGANGASFRIATPGVAGAITGVPECDEAIHRYRRTRAAIG